MQLLLFDIDQTLLNSLGAGRTAMARAFAQLYGDRGVFESMQIDGRTDRAIFSEALRHHGVGEEAMEAAFEAVTETYLGLLPGTLEECGGRVLDGVPELLAALPCEGVAVGIATGNLARGAAIKLGHFGLAEQFTAGGYGDHSAERVDVIEMGIREIAATARADPEPANAVVIGDTPLDIAAAHGAGARVVAVATGTFSVEELAAAGAASVLPDLADTERALAAILGGGRVN